MAHDTDVIECLERYAQTIARKVLLRYDLAHDNGWHEDITQSLLLAGKLDFASPFDKLGTPARRLSCFAEASQDSA